MAIAHEPRDKPGAGHGTPSEVRWRSGQGRQPYANQGPQEAEETNCGDQYDSGDRGRHSGTNQEQMRQVTGVPDTPPPGPDVP